MTENESEQRRGDNDTDSLLEGLSHSLHQLDSLDCGQSDAISCHDNTSRFPRNPLWWARQPCGNPRFVIKPVFGSVQRLPVNLIEQFAFNKARKLAAFVGLCLLWLAIFVTLTVQTVNKVYVPVLGAPRRVSCTSTPWPNDDRNCGLNGVNCLPFENASFAFRCPPNCAGAMVLENRTVGAEFVIYKPLVVGGPSDMHTQQDHEIFYRGDSFICAAAIHAGVIENTSGGCGILSLLGRKSSYSSTQHNGITSLGFDSSFPMSFEIKPLNEQNSRCLDLRWVILTASVLFTLTISLCTTSPAAFYFSVFTVIFYQVALVSDTPNLEDYSSLLQMALSRFLPAIFVAFVIFVVCAQKTLTGLEAQIEKTLLWLGGCWFGALENYTLDKLPLQRLTPRDFSQPGAVIVFLVAISFISIAAVYQARVLWLEGRFNQFLCLYACLACGLVLLSLIPGMNLRIHHYILALILLPGTATQTRPSLLFQGFLLGLFINGVARWGFASILETDAYLARPGQTGSPLPAFSTPIIDGLNITFTFNFTHNIAKNWDGISMQVNDVERFRWFKHNTSAVLSWTRTQDEPLYFRFGYYRIGLMNGISQGDYTPPGTWSRDGSWSWVKSKML